MVVVVAALGTAGLVLVAGGLVRVVGAAGFVFDKAGLAVTAAAGGVVVWANDGTIIDAAVTRTAKIVSWVVRIFIRRLFSGRCDVVKLGRSDQLRKGAAGSATPGGQKTKARLLQGSGDQGHQTCWKNAKEKDESGESGQGSLL